MKCVKHKTTGEIKRLSEERATALVGDGNWQFIPKKEWKLQRPVKAVVETAVQDLLVTGELKPRKIPGKKSAYREEKRRKRNESK